MRGAGGGERAHVVVAKTCAYSRVADVSRPARPGSLV